jgi:glyoxylase-like metal-dependent hydrolase (beta-lactamase superfamily II)
MIFRLVIFGIALSSAATPLTAQIVPGSLEVHWNPGADDCKTNTAPPMQVHQYESRTFILRQNLCISFEGNFLFLVVGSQKALLVDTGAVADPATMPVARTVLDLLPTKGNAKLPLLVVHTHGHTDHHDGDPQFANLPNVQVAPFDLNGVKAFFGFYAWPIGVAHIDLGDRVVDVIPAPGHHPAHLVFYDNRTGLLITGDFFLPGHLLIEDLHADKQSAARVIDFLKTRPVSYVLGTHVEMDRNGELYTWGSHYHPHEHVLQLSKEDLLELPAALNSFNGFYSRYGIFVMMNQYRVLMAELIAVLVILAAIVYALRRLWRRLRKKRSSASANV